MLKDNADEDIERAIRAVAAGKPYFSPAISRALLADDVRLMRKRGVQDSYDLLTEREREILQLLAEGKSNKEAAAVLKSQSLYGRDTPHQHDAKTGTPQYRRNRPVRCAQGDYYTLMAPQQPPVPPSSPTLKVRRWLDELRRNENHLTLILSLLIGALVGLVVVAFILLTGRLAARMYPAGGSGWRRILVPTVGSLVTGYLLWRFFPAARGSGIPQTKAALFIHDGRITFRTVAGKFLCCSASLATGMALGREGPSVQIGAGLASVIARNTGLSTKQVKALVPVGCSAALAAAFNTPIAAVLFSLEEIMGDLNATVLGTAVLSSATSWMVLHLVLGDDPLFHVTGYRLINPWELAVYAVLGVVGGLGSTVFVKLLLRLREWFAQLPRNTVWFQPVAGGLAVGIMGYFAPNVMGVGYNFVEQVLNGDVVLKTVVLLGVLKIIATCHVLFIRQRRRDFRAQLVHRGHDGRRGGQYRPHSFP